MSDESAFTFQKPNVEVMEKVSAKIDKSKNIPLNYIPIKLPSNGKLGYAPTLHFRNFSMGELLDLASVAQHKVLPVLVRCLNQMCFEGYDFSALHERDLEVIMLTLFANFQGATLKNKPYFLDPDLEGDALFADANIGYANLDIPSIEIKFLGDEVRSPFKITQKTGFSAMFEFPTIKHILVAEETTTEQFKELDRKWASFAKKLENLGDTPNREDVINPLDEEAYQAYQSDRSAYFTKTLQTLLLVQIGSKKLETIAEKASGYQNIDPSMWRDYNKVIANNSFGINPEVTFFSVPLEKEITRRFLFQLLDFLPTMDETDDGGNAIDFGTVSD